MIPRRCIYFLILFFNCATVAQEKPFFTTELYDTSISYRQNVCDRHKAYYAGDVEFRDALKDTNLNVLMGATSLFQLKDGAIDPEYPGLVGVLMDELAERAGFSWRNSYGIFYGSGDNHTYSDVLTWAVETYDLTADWWQHSVERLKQGVAFPKGFYDASFILVGMKGNDMEDSSIDLFNWLEPFEDRVWWAILGTIIASGIIYMVLESLHIGDQYHWRFVWNIFLSMLLFTQHFQFNPHSYAGRVFSISLSFWSLIIISSYTANLASYFVVQNAPTVKINGIDDAIRASMSICIWEGTGAEEFARATYPQGLFVGKDSEEESLLGVKSGDCDLALLSVQSWEMLESDRSINGDCNLAWVGRVIKFNDAGLALKHDAGVLCTSLIEDVLNAHLSEMQSDGFVDNAWKDFYRREQDLDCTAIATLSEGKDSSSQLSLEHIAGTFFIHFLATLFALVIAIISKCRNAKNPDKTRRYSGAVEELNMVNTETVQYPEPSSQRSNPGETLHTIVDIQDQLQDLKDSHRDIKLAQQEQKEQIWKLMSFLQENIKKDT